MLGSYLLIFYYHNQTKHRCGTHSMNHLNNKTLQFIILINTTVLLLFGYEFEANEKVARATRRNISTWQRLSFESIPQWQAIHATHAWYG
jgi:hypothetical protein